MQSLLVQALAMRQLGRLNPRHLLAAGYGLQGPEWCPRTIHTRQLWGCTAVATSGGCHRPTAKSWALHQLRFKSTKKGKAARATQVEEEEEEGRDTEESDEDEEEEDPNTPKDYKDIKTYVQSFRYDIIMKAGLGMARHKIEDAFYSHKLRLNGQKLTKKSKAVKVGATLDLLLAENPETNTVTLMRVVFRKVLGQSNDGEKHYVLVRRWKHINVSKDETFTP